MTSSGLEPPTCRLVAYCFNELRYRAPLCWVVDNVSHSMNEWVEIVATLIGTKRIKCNKIWILKFLSTIFLSRQAIFLIWSSCNVLKPGADPVWMHIICLYEVKTVWLKELGILIFPQLYILTPDIILPICQHSLLLGLFPSFCSSFSENIIAIMKCWA
jgi:hypothetical protein